MERNNRPITDEETQTTPFAEVFQDLAVEESLVQAMNRWQEVLFVRDYTDEAGRLLERANSFTGFNAGEIANGSYQNDFLGQFTGTIGQLKNSMSFAAMQGRELKDFELERASAGIQKAADFKAKTVARFEGYSLEPSDHPSNDYARSMSHLAKVNREEVGQMRTIAENIPTVVNVIVELQKRTAR